MLPRLSLHDLARLACTSSILRDTVNQQEAAWRYAATACLPPGLCFQIGAQGRAGVQKLMQRRSTASRNICSGRALKGPTIELSFADAGWTTPQLVFSDDSKLLACKFAGHVAVYVADSGHMMWRRSFKDVVSQLGLPFNIKLSTLEIGWPAGSGSLIAYYQTASETPQDAAAAFHANLLRIDVKSGAASLGPAICLDLSEAPLHIQCLTWASFAPDAAFLEISLGHESQDADSIVPLKFFSLSLVDATSGAVILAARMDDWCPISRWAPNSRLFFGGDGQVFDIALQSITRIADEYHMEDVAFDGRSDPRSIGFSHSKGGQDAIVLDLQSYNVMLSVPESCFVGFTSIRQHAVTRPLPCWSGSCLQVWDTLQRHRLFQIELGYSQSSCVSFLLSDMLLATLAPSNAPRPQPLKPLWYCLAYVDSKRPMGCKLGRLKDCFCSKDECSFALVKHAQDGDHRYTVKVIRWAEQLTS